ncbi:tetratricopeptide repeat protein [Pseudomonas multiresinivorans]|uniref:Sel1 repeat family protein n=1 Tax=Pseudomonas multiresinivorans TaxID=95301 RepID=A0A7Z3GPK1_9PSED|nr:tetratricopeptide repeat protein [Pseudomonas multiresinivorans]QJP07786.1 sel1 repeat family protein [Pseudomonas multiresinivorans]
MPRRSEDIFLSKMDSVAASVIKEAIKKVDQGDCDRARELLNPLIIKKDAAAIFYAATFGVPGESLEHFEKRRIEQLQQSAKYGYAPAMHELAIHYDSGDLVPRNLEKAAQLFRQAAEKGHPHAQWIYGLDLIHGRNGIEKDEKLGIEYVKKSAESKFEGALESMAEFYKKGIHGFPLDADKARHFQGKTNDKDIIGY